MKKWLGVLLSALLTVTLLLTTIGTVQADAPAPTVTPVSGITDFTTTIVSFNNLPGTVQNSEGLVFPAGFTIGEKQFEGEGIKISGFTYGTAKACFPITAVNQGWGGQVAKWNGEKWTLLDTTITTPADSAFSFACSTVSGDGTYAMIGWVVDASKLPTEPDCGFTVTAYSVYLSNVHSISATRDSYTAEKYTFASSENLAGKKVTISLLQVTPTGMVVSLSENPTGTFVADGALYSFTDPVTVIIDTTKTPPTLIKIRVNFGSCKVDTYFGTPS